MKKTDTLFIGVILGLLVLVAHYSVVGGSIFASLMVLMNLLDSKERLTIRSQVKNKRISPKFNNKKVHNK